MWVLPSVCSSAFALRLLVLADLIRCSSSHSVSASLTLSLHAAYAVPFTLMTWHLSRTHRCVYISGISLKVNCYVRLLLEFNLYNLNHFQIEHAFILLHRMDITTRRMKGKKVRWRKNKNAHHCTWCECACAGSLCTRTHSVNRRFVRTTVQWRTREWERDDDDEERNSQTIAIDYTFNPIKFLLLILYTNTNPLDCNNKINASNVHRYLST